MWKIKVYKKYRTYEFTDKFIEDILLWACRNRNLKTSKQVMKTNMSNELKALASYGSYKDNFKKNMLILSKCRDIAKVWRTFRIYKEKYYRIIQGDTKPPKLLNKSTIAEIKPVFEYFYDTLLDNGFFWKTYNPTGVFQKRQKIREILGSETICPYCDQTHINSNLKSNMDHFLPISAFPFLSVFWKNIVMSCVICNGNLIKRSNWYLPMLHPYFDDIENVLYFTFNEQENTILVRAREGVEGIKRSKIRGQNMIRLLKHNETHKGLWAIIDDEKHCIKQAIKTYYIDSKKKGTNKTLDEYIKGGVNFRKFYLKRNIRKLPSIKLRMDYNDAYLKKRDLKMVEWLLKQ